jgi:hypothetical protein
MLYYKLRWVNHGIKNIKHNFCSMTNYTFPNINGLLTTNPNKDFHKVFYNIYFKIIQSNNIKERAIILDKEIDFGPPIVNKRIHYTIINRLTKQGYIIKEFTAAERIGFKLIYKDYYKITW